MAIYRNSIYISKNKVDKLIENFSNKEIFEKNYILNDNIPILKNGKNVLLGWAWNCKSGKKVNENDISILCFENLVELTQDFSGRYIIIIDSKYLFTDATSSFPIYYTRSSLSTNLSLLCTVDDLEIDNNQKIFSKEFILPPTSPVKGVKRLIPGEYLNLENMQALTIENYFNIDRFEFDLENHINELSQYMINCGKGLKEVVKSDYRLMMTGGKDSRLSFLSLYNSESNDIKTVTHRKPFIFNTKSDLLIPKKLSKILKYSHQQTNPSKSKLDLKKVANHCGYLSYEQQPGATWFYYTHGNWEQINEEFLIDNYYEIGRMHLYNKGKIGTEKLTYELFKEIGIKIDEADSVKLFNHMNKLSTNVNSLDIFYFIKNYINVANQFESMDYLHTPLMYCNSLNLFKLLLNVPEKYRMNGYFHYKLIEKLDLDLLKDISCNPKASTLIGRIKNKIKSEIMKKVYNG